VAQVLPLKNFANVLRHFDQALQGRNHLMGDTAARNLEHFILRMELCVLFDLADISKIKH